MQDRNPVAQAEVAETPGRRTEILAADADTRTPAFYRQRAADVRAVGSLAEATACAAETAFSDLGSVGLDFGQRVALRLRECAREASWTAGQLDVWADETPCVEVGRLEEVRNAAPVVVLADAAGRTDVA